MVTWCSAQRVPTTPRIRLQFMDLPARREFNVRSTRPRSRPGCWSLCCQVLCNGGLPKTYSALTLTIPPPIADHTRGTLGVCSTMHGRKYRSRELTNEHNNHLSCGETVDDDTHTLPKKMLMNTYSTSLFAPHTQTRRRGARSWGGRRGQGGRGGCTRYRAWSVVASMGEGYRAICLRQMTMSEENLRCNHVGRF